MTHKNSSINLGINFAVYIIIAIVFLVIGILFIKNALNPLDDLNEITKGIIHKEMINKLKESSKDVDILKYVYEMKKNKKKIIYIGFKNTYSREKIFIIKGIRVTSIPGEEVGCGVYNSDNIVVQYKREGTNVKPGRTAVLPLKIITKDAKPGTCFYEVFIGIEDDNLIGYYNFNDKTSYDISGNNNNGTINQANWTKEGFTEGAYKFDPLITNLAYDNIDIGEISFEGNELTVSAWVKISPNANKYSYIASKYSVFNFFLENFNGSLKFCTDMFFIYPVNACVNQSLEIGRSYHLAFSYSDTDKKIRHYINGIKKSEKDADGLINKVSTNFYIGYPSADTFNGTIDEVYIYNKALTDDKIMQLYLGYDSIIQFSVNVE